MQHAVDSVPSLSRLALASAGGASGGGGGGGGRTGSGGGASSAATAGPNATFTIRTPFGVDADRGDGVLGWLSLEGSGGSSAPTIPAGGSRPANFTASGKGRPGKDVGRSEAAGSNFSAALGVSSRAGTAPEQSLWLGDRTAQAPVVLLRRRSPEADTLSASALVTAGGLGLFPPPAEGLAGAAAAPAGAGRGGPQSQPSAGPEDPKVSGCRRDDRRTAATPTQFVSAGEEMRARAQKRKGSGDAAAPDGSRGEATPAVAEEEVKT